MAESAGIKGVRVSKAADLGEAVEEAIKANVPYVIDANIQGEGNPVGAGVWELPGLGHGQPAIGARTVL
jgi:acetolactate synthase-1/2/3 large subunit